MGRIKYSCVEEQHKNIIIVASGPSAKQFEPMEGWVVIAVNAAIGLTREHTDYWFTLDPSIENRRIMANKPQDCDYFAAVPSDFGMRNARVIGNRQRPPKGVRYLKRLYNPETRLGEKLGLSENCDEIHTGNSAYGALGLAYLMGAENIIILGLDGSKEKKIDGTRCKGTLDHLPSLFASTKEQLENSGCMVINASPRSLIDAFPRTKFSTAKHYFEKVIHGN